MRLAHAVLSLALLSSPALATSPVDPPPAERSAPAADGPVVQIALLLDTSNSMDGLIDQARSQLWRVVDEMGKARRGSKRVRLQLALYEYGNDTLPARGGHIRQVLPFTEDLDAVSEKLFALRTNGGQEYCGQAIQRATTELAWSRSREDLKLLFIAGNEPFSQGPVKWASAVAAARERGIVVNTLHCAQGGGQLEEGWKEAAALAQGRFMSIDHNAKVAHVAAPQDAEIARLGAQLNQTYVGYGAQGAQAKARQEAQDANAQAAGMGSLTTRAKAKASRLYKASSWDLVDAVKEGKVDLDTAPAAQLPAEVRTLPSAQKKEWVQKKAAEREALQARIRKLSEEREAHVAAEKQKQAKAGAATLDAAVVETVRTQAAAQQYSFE